MGVAVGTLVDQRPYRRDPYVRNYLILCCVAHKMRYVKAALMLYRKGKPLNLNPFFSIDST